MQQTRPWARMRLTTRTTHSLTRLVRTREPLRGRRVVLRWWLRAQIASGQALRVPAGLWPAAPPARPGPPGRQ